MRSFARSDQAQAMVEFALVLPIILLLLFGMLQFALVLNARQTVAYAAQAAANGYAQTLQRSQGDASARSAAVQLRPEFGRVGRVEYRLIRGGSESVIGADGTGVFNDLVVARATYEYPSPIRAGVAGFRFPETIAVSAEAVARIESGSAAADGSAPVLPPVASASPTPPPPSPTPTPVATSASCFYFNGLADLPRMQSFSRRWFPTFPVKVDGSTAAIHRYWTPGSTHRIEIQYQMNTSFPSRTSYQTVSFVITVPSAGTIGTAYEQRSTLSFFGYPGTIVTRLTGMSTAQCARGGPP